MAGTLVQVKYFWVKMFLWEMEADINGELSYRVNNLAFNIFFCSEMEFDLQEVQKGSHLQAR